MIELLTPARSTRVDNGICARDPLAMAAYVTLRTDGGDVTRVTVIAGEMIATAATDPGAAAALTSSQNATPAGTNAGTTQTLANALQTSYNAVQVDVAALRTKLNALIANLSAGGVTSS